MNWGIDNRIKARRGISARLNHAQKSLNVIEQRIHNLTNVINQSMNKYDHTQRMLNIKAMGLYKLDGGIKPWHSLFALSLFARGFIVGGPAAAKYPYGMPGVFGNYFNRGNIGGPASLLQYYGMNHIGGNANTPTTGNMRDLLMGAMFPMGAMGGLIKGLQGSQTGGKASNAYNLGSTLAKGFTATIPKTSNDITKDLGVCYIDNSKTRWTNEGHLIGDKKENSQYGMTASGGVGYYDSDWAGLSGFKNGHGQIGGNATFSTIHGSLELDNAFVNGNATIDMLTAQGKAVIGGEGILPVAILSADARYLGYEGRAQPGSFTEKIPGADTIGFNRYGFHGNAEVLTAKAHAGVDNFTVGIGAKAAAAEGKIGTIIPIPFTDYNIKPHIGGSAGSIGGEAKLGLENKLGIHIGLGLEFGLTFEKDPNK